MPARSEAARRRLHFAADGEGYLPYPLYGGAVDKAIDVAEGDRAAGFQGFVHGRGAFGFETDDLCFG